MHVPEMVTIREASKRSRIPECALRKWVNDGLIRSVKSGNRFYLVWGSVVRFLAGDDQEEGGGII